LLIISVIHFAVSLCCKAVVLILFMPPLAISHRRHAVLGLSVHPLCGHIVKVCEHILQTTCGDFSKFTLLDAVGDKGELMRF